MTLRKNRLSGLGRIETVRFVPEADETGALKLPLKVSYAAFRSTTIFVSSSIPTKVRTCMLPDASRQVVEK